jgi:hypothetical protein
MSKGLVYILTNPSLQGWIKIGYTADEDIKKRVKELNVSTSIPLSFRVYATLKIENAYEIEQSIHTIFDTIDKSLHSIEKTEDGKERIREFFQISPEKAFIILQEVAKLTHTEKDLTLGIPTKKEIEEEEIGENAGKRKNITFEELGLQKDDELVFLKDKTIRCKIVDNKNTVLYNNEETTLSAIAKKLLGYNVNGYKMFMSQNETLWDRRIRLENEKEEN